MASEEMIFFFFLVGGGVDLAFLLPWQPIKFSGFDKFHVFKKDYSRNISVKLLSKYQQ